VREGRCNWFCQESLQGARASVTSFILAFRVLHQLILISLRSHALCGEIRKAQHRVHGESLRGTEKSSEFTQQGYGIPRRREQALARLSTIEIYFAGSNQSRTRVRSIATALSSQYSSRTLRLKWLCGVRRFVTAVCFKPMLDLNELRWGTNENSALIFLLFAFPLAVPAQRQSNFTCYLNETQILGRRVFQQRCAICHTESTPGAGDTARYCPRNWSTQ